MRRGGGWESNPMERTNVSWYPEFCHRYRKATRSAEQSRRAFCRRCPQAGPAKPSTKSSASDNNTRSSTAADPGSNPVVEVRRRQSSVPPAFGHRLSGVYRNAGASVVLIHATPRFREPGSLVTLPKHSAAAGQHAYCDEVMTDTRCNRGSLSGTMKSKRLPCSSPR